MAISYSLDIAATGTADEVAREFRDMLSEEDHMSIESNEWWTRHALKIQVLPDNPPAWNPIVTDLGFTPSVSVGFRMAKMIDIAPQQDDMVRLAIGLLGRVPGDAVLHSEFDQIWLLRRGRELLLSDRDDIWPLHRLALAPRPCRRAALTFAD
ncbi:SitI3 family protein [Actinokineospora iranica]|uniref:Uncharacterized protein n=1 Tax=Actinokineospora iranica TaxID=1271860 RepID=A0A1G6JVJ8_9PSEU|nr:SitI3 family protein [Actinokineospora iranica]SDC22762.1 hypothetical protein SAMN05216174_101582 [Actinokineospora iranica]